MKPITALKYLLPLLVLFTSSQLQAQKTTGYAPVNGLKIYYEVHGSGEPLVLLHGAFMTIDLNWAAFIPELAKNRKVIALEIQGHGHTADSERPFSYEGFASDVVGVLQHLKIDRADIVGYSFGGTIAIQTAIAYPEKVNKLVVISSGYKQEAWKPEMHSQLSSLQPDFLDQTPLKGAYDSIAPDLAHWHSFVKKFLEFDLKDYNLGEENIKKIKAPTLLIIGDNDGTELKAVAEFYQQLGGNVFGDLAGVPPSHLAIIPGMTHIGLMMEPDMPLNLLKKFLNNIPKN